MERRLRRILVVFAVVVALAGAALGTAWIVKRPIRWKDARTMPPPLEAAVRAYAKGDASSGLESVREFLRRYRAPAWDARARVLAAAHLAREGRERDILAVLPEELAPDDALATHAMLLRASGFLARGTPERAAELAARAAGTTDFPESDDARMTEANALAAKGEWRHALDLLDALPGPAAAIAASRICAARSDVEGARHRLVGALFRADGDSDVDRLRESLESLVQNPELRLLPAERPELAERARDWLEDGRAKTAVGLLRFVRPAGVPSAATGAEALIEAEALLKLGRLDEMGALLARARFAGHGSDDGARYLQARRTATMGSFGAYRGSLEGLARTGVSPWRERALLDLARMVEGAPNPATLQAYRRYRLAAGARADHVALFREAWAAFELGRIAEADAAFSRTLAQPGVPDGVRVAATYWSARIAEGAGRTAYARASYTSLADDFGNHYYGALAAKRLGRPAPAAPAILPPVSDKAPTARSLRWLPAARALVSVGLWDEAAACYGAAVKEAGIEAPALALEAAAAARAAGAGSDAIGIAQTAAGDRDRTPVQRLPLPLWRLLYPAPFGQELTRAARGASLDPNVVAAVALQESAFNPLAVSGPGARGLLQVMPAVGAELARAAGIERFSPADLFDPATNLKLGSAHLADYLQRFGSIPLALAAFNGGPSRVERWSLPAGRDDDERFVERIPIPETRLYVKRVLAGARMYAIAWPNGLGVE